MKSIVRALAAMLCLALVVVMAACGPDVSDPKETTIPATTLQPLNAREKYDLATAEVTAAKNLQLRYTRTEIRSVGQATYTRSVAGTASYAAINSKDMEAVVEEQLTYGTYKSAYKEVYCDGAPYVQVQGSAFTSQQTPQEFLARQLPAVLLQQELYRSVTESAAADGNTRLTFADATAAESWLALPKKASLISAGGTVLLNNQGSLVQSDYQLEYQQGTTRYSLTISVQVAMPKSLDLGAIHSEHFHGSSHIVMLDAPKLLLQVVGDIYAAGTFRCEATEKVFSEAVPMTYKQKSVFSLQGSLDKMTANAKYTISISDYRGEMERQTREESYRDGIYTTVADGSTKETVITAEAMRQYYEDAILSALLAPTFMSNASSWTGASQLHLNLSGNQSFAKALLEEIGKLLQVELASDEIKIRPDGIGGYIAINRDTGLPEEMGLFLSCTHTVGGISYNFTYNLDQKITLSK